MPTHSKSLWLDWRKLFIVGLAKLFEIGSIKISELGLAPALKIPELGLAEKCQGSDWQEFVVDFLVSRAAPPPATARENNGIPTCFASAARNSGALEIESLDSDWSQRHVRF